MANELHAFNRKLIIKYSQIRREGWSSRTTHLREFQSGSKKIWGKKGKKVTTKHKANAGGFTSTLTSN